MNPLERRMAKLEASRPDANQIDIIIRRIVGTDDEVVRAVIGDHVVDRRADEAEDDFVGRAKVDALAGTERRPWRMIFLPEEVLHEDTRTSLGQTGKRTSDAARADVLSAGGTAD
ncbi:MAG: hypothetical protein V5B34_07665 [Accumulibacter sp.]|jgi:hypothetical protein